MDSNNIGMNRSRKRAEIDTFYQESQPSVVEKKKQKKICDRCGVGGLMYQQVKCEPCLRYLNNLPPTYCKMKQKLICDFLHQVLLDLSVKEIYFNLPIYCSFSPSSLNKKSKGKKKIIIPDLRFTWMEWNIIVEIDEHKHKSYVKDENNRIDMIRSVFNQKVILLRINPDSDGVFPAMIVKLPKKISADGRMFVDTIIKHSGEIERRFQIIHKLIKDIIFSISNNGSGFPLEHKLFF